MTEICEICGDELEFVERISDKTEKWECAGCGQRYHIINASDFRGVRE